MNVIDTPTPYGYTLFCDDIRHEVSGKVTLVGIYLRDLIVPSLPARLAQLHMRVAYHESPGESSEPVELKIYLPGDPDSEPTLQAPIPLDEMRKNAPAAQAAFEKEQEALGELRAGRLVLTGLFDIRLSPLELKQEGFLRVRAYRGDNEIRLGSLQVRSREGAEGTAKQTPLASGEITKPSP